MKDFNLEELEIREELEKEKARNSLIDFITYTQPSYEVIWFHKAICEWIDKLLRRDIKKLMIFIPPQHGKTEISSRKTPAYALGRNPREKVILMSYNLTKASEFCTDCNRIIKSEEFEELFPEVQINGRDKTDFFEINNGTGFYKSAGIGSGITGTTGTIGIIDDPFKGRVEANSKLNRDTAWKTYQDDFKTRLNNNSVELMLFTRWHEDDLAGRILDPKNDYYDEEEANEWTVIAIPALKEETKPIPCALDLDDPRVIDEALWEEKHSADKYIKRRRINPAGFASLDQQRPSPVEGNKIKKEWWEVVSEGELPFSLNSITPDFFIDGAFTDSTQNDETGLISAYYHKRNDTLYILNCSGVRKELYEFLPYFKQYANANHYKRTSSVYIELKASGHPMKSMLSKVEHGSFNCRAINNKIVGLGKWNRVENSEPFIASGKVKLLKGSWNNAFIDQCGAFPNGSHDDMLDVACYGIHQYFIRTSTSGVSYEE